MATTIVGRRLLTIIGAVLLFAPDLSGTAVVVFRTDRVVVLASDSMEETQSGDGPAVHTLKCKVRPAGRWWTTLAGFSGSTIPPLDVQAVLTSAVTPARTMTEVKDAIMGRVFPRVHAALEAGREDKAFALTFEKGQLAQQIVVAGSTADDPTLRVGTFVVVLDGVAPLTVTTAFLECPGRWCPDGRLFFGASVDASGPTVARLIAPRASWVERADAAAARRVIAEQIAATPSLVSAPIDVLELSADSGARWVQRDAASKCSALN